MVRRQAELERLVHTRLVLPVAVGVEREVGHAADAVDDERAGSPYFSMRTGNGGRFSSRGGFFFNSFNTSSIAFSS